MATWVIHLRVADAMRNRWQPLQMLPELPFVVGNLAPDGGVEVSPHVYVPDSATTHWTPTGKKRDIDAEAFCRAYLQNPALTPEQTAFYRGYEAHLRTDVEWIRQILKPLKQKLGIAHFTGTPYDGLLRQNLTYLEQAFCRQAKSFPAWELAQQTKAFPNDVLPYYAEDTLTLKLQELRERYAEPVAPPEQYLVTAEQLDVFVRQTVEQIVSVWQKEQKNKCS